jgi:hypothetical protein
LDSEPTIRSAPFLIILSSNTHSFQFTDLLIFSLSVSTRFPRQADLDSKRPSINALSLISGVIAIAETADSAATSETAAGGEAAVAAKAKLLFQAFDFMQKGVITDAEVTMLFESVWSAVGSMTGYGSSSNGNSNSISSDSLVDDGERSSTQDGDGDEEEDGVSSMARNTEALVKWLKDQRKAQGVVVAPPSRSRSRSKGRKKNRSRGAGGGCNGGGGDGGVIGDSDSALRESGGWRRAANERKGGGAAPAFASAASFVDDDDDDDYFGVSSGSAGGNNGGMEGEEQEGEVVVLGEAEFVAWAVEAVGKLGDAKHLPDLMFKVRRRCCCCSLLLSMFKVRCCFQKMKKMKGGGGLVELFWCC